jgi:hypothetical protein
MFTSHNRKRWKSKVKLLPCFKKKWKSTEASAKRWKTENNYSFTKIREVSVINVLTDRFNY